MFEHRIFTDFVYLMVVIEPISLVPEFLAVTRHQTPPVRRKTAIRAVLISAVILVAFIVIGQILLEAFGIRLPSFSIAGGLVLLGISLQRVLSAADVRVDEEAAREEVGDVAVFPLATPYIAGPAAILAVVLLTDNSTFGFFEQAQTTAVMLVVLAVTCAVLLAAGTLDRLLGTTGADVISRISGLILAALAVETCRASARPSRFPCPENVVSGFRRWGAPSCIVAVAGFGKPGRCQAG